MYTSSHGNPKYPPAGYPTAPMNLPPPSHISPFRGSAASASSWSTGLCHCCDDPANCLITAFCPCVTFGQIAQIVNKGSISCAASGAVYGLLALTGLSCLYSCVYRSRLRGQYDLEEAPCADCLVHFCCETCSLCQEYRELKNRGFDMGIGWQANMDRHGRGITVAPVVGRMAR
ncbi:hypothetical protein ES288_A02G190400v1 [Gossypium darwinii]|uniref:Cell number regulator 1 n=1 Tax=Gossypium darwinii TaxID=34276 RepID=A0A5D2HFM9_GOSDA|nr:hypothetical protein ES288_A02G190400v1 [Gossypium darwinii]